MLSLNDFADHRAVTLTISLRHEGGHDRARAAAMVTKCDLIRLPSMCVVVFHRGCFPPSRNLSIQIQRSIEVHLHLLVLLCNTRPCVQFWLDPTTGAAFRKATRPTRSPQSHRTNAGVRHTIVHINGREEQLTLGGHVLDQLWDVLGLWVRGALHNLATVHPCCTQPLSPCLRASTRSHRHYRLRQFCRSHLHEAR